MDGSARATCVALLNKLVCCFELRDAGLPSDVSGGIAMWTKSLLKDVFAQVPAVAGGGSSRWVLCVFLFCFVFLCECSGSTRVGKRKKAEGERPPEGRPAKQNRTGRSNRDGPDDACAQTGGETATNNVDAQQDAMPSETSDLAELGGERIALRVEDEKEIGVGLGDGEAIALEFEDEEGIALGLSDEKSIASRPSDEEKTALELNDEVILLDHEEPQVEAGQQTAAEHDDQAIPRSDEASQDDYEELAHILISLL
jgi:hypothetical protein